MATDFAVFLRRFLTAHLAGLRGCSPNTIASYRDAFKLLIATSATSRSIPPEQAHPRSRSTPPPSPGSWTGSRPAGATASSTRNQRLAAISSFFRWMQTQDPARMAVLPGHPRDPRQANTTGRPWTT